MSDDLKQLIFDLLLDLKYEKREEFVVYDRLIECFEMYKRGEIK